MQILFLMCISGRTKVGLRLPFSQLWHDRRREGRRGGLNKRLQSWRTVRLLSCQKNGKEKREIKLSFDSKPMHNAMMHVHKIAPTHADALQTCTMFLYKFLYNLYSIFIRGGLCLKIEVLRGDFSLINSFNGHCKPQKNEWINKIVFKSSNFKMFWWSMDIHY